MMNKEERKQSILDKQMEMAMDGSIEMLKWLGIQYCKQSNQPTTPDDELPNGFDVRVIGRDGQVLNDCPSCARRKRREEGNGDRILTG